MLYFVSSIYLQYVYYLFPDIRSCRTICFLKDISDVEEVWLWQTSRKDRSDALSR